MVKAKFLSEKQNTLEDIYNAIERKDPLDVKMEIMNYYEHFCFANRERLEAKFKK